MIAFSRKATPPPLDPAADLIGAAVRLVGMLDRENLALTALDLAGAAALVTDKSAALAAFQTACERMGGRRITDPDHAQAATLLSQQLQDLAKDNSHLLERALFVQKRVIALFARAAVSSDGERYGARGGTAPSIRAVAVSARA